ncbi:hypothetical protein CKO35_01655 [Ectothiorhodospira shaposhnikovii]|uniref:hypothetical protein n=1 Tax=Ectothiorhodospira shaposhnikovii TaxID=1054 RepID=UPI00190419E8|nr:hypothetical protein [Ectothiorhodospira shaposhnikovii]MBK1672021.1 hypothetical protein [Ectothiorhodospira shaposhnikovii]
MAQHSIHTPAQAHHREVVLRRRMVALERELRHLEEELNRVHQATGARGLPGRQPHNPGFSHPIPVAAG